jgi:hypothetical protein
LQHFTSSVLFDTGTLCFVLSASSSYFSRLFPPHHCPSYFHKEHSIPVVLGFVKMHFDLLTPNEL